MALSKLTLPVLISSKQIEFAAEREDIVALMRPMPLLAVDAAQNWAPEARPVEKKSVDQAASCAIYVGLFGCIYSEPTILEYRSASGNRYREILIYIKDCPKREGPLAEFLKEVMDPKTGRTVVRYSDWSKVRKRFREHLWEATGRMVQHLLRLADPPAAMGEDGSILERRWVVEKKALLNLGLPSNPGEARELARFFENERLKPRGGL